MLFFFKPLRGLILPSNSYRESLGAQRYISHMQQLRRSLYKPLPPTPSRRSPAPSPQNSCKRNSTEAFRRISTPTTRVTATMRTPIRGLSEKRPQGLPTTIPQHPGDTNSCTGRLSVEMSQPPPPPPCRPQATRDAAYSNSIIKSRCRAPPASHLTLLPSHPRPRSIGRPDGDITMATLDAEGPVGTNVIYITTSC